MSDDQESQVLLTFSDEDEKEKIEKFKAENPGKSFEVIPVRFIAPPARENNE
ncbi:hypothetical protein ACFLZM_06080 [Thermodesulfobacteriota bacterium]